MKTRQELKVKFSDHQCPSGADYASIFDSTINLANDAIVLPDPLFKGPNPLTINAIRDKKYALRLNHQLQIQHSDGDGRIYGGANILGEHRGLQIQAHPEEYKGAYIILRPADYFKPTSRGCLFLTFGDYKAPAPEGSSLYIRVASNESVRDVMTVDVEGRVGIGIRSKNFPLEVSNPEKPVLQVGHNAAGAIISGTSGGRALYGSNIYLARITENNETADQLRTAYDNNSNYGFAGIYINWGELRFLSLEGNTSKDTPISSEKLQLSSRLTVKKNGNVGVGTSTPRAPLHVEFANSEEEFLTLAEFSRKETSGGSAKIKIRGSRYFANSEVASIEFADFDALPSPGKEYLLAKIVAGKLDENSTGQLSFFTNNGQQLNEQVKIDTTGCVYLGKIASINTEALNIIGEVKFSKHPHNVNRLNKVEFEEGIEMVGVPIYKIMDGGLLEFAGNGTVTKKSTFSVNSLYEILNSWFFFSHFEVKPTSVKSDAGIISKIEIDDTTFSSFSRTVNVTLGTHTNLAFTGKATVVAILQLNKTA
ncbi:MAG: hypothetical protein KDC75_03745 [Phaeodactylibacter sp.]|nr:hypothetical protein [Phaeodactylibacter sp.]MCB9304648.1 hypothetical protein [Lewinellaceae bacterium]